MKGFAAVLVVLSLSVSAPAALAETKSYPGTTSLTLSGYRLSGTLSSPLPACEKNRYITVYSVGADGTLSAAAPATTNDSGYWITGTGFFTPGQTYVARTPAKILPKQGQQVRKCQAVSKRRTLPVPPPPG